MADAQALLAAVESSAQRPEDEASRSEILALRKIVINLLYSENARGFESLPPSH